MISAHLWSLEAYLSGCVCPCLHQPSPAMTHKQVCHSPSLAGGGGGLGTGCPCVAQASDFFNEAFSFFSWSKREKSRFYRNFSEGDHYVLLDKSRILVVRDFKFISYEIAIAWWGQVRGRMTWDNRNKRLTPGVGVLCENHRRSTGEFSL